MENYRFTEAYAAIEQWIGHDGVALLCQAVEEVRKHQADLDALFQRWVVRPAYTEAFYRQLLHDSQFCESLTALRAELAQHIMQAYQASPEELFWRLSYWWWKIPEACDAPLRQFVQQWELPQRAMGDIIASVLQAVDLHLNQQVPLTGKFWKIPTPNPDLHLSQQVPLETALSGELLSYCGVKWSQLQAMEDKLYFAIIFLDSLLARVLQEDTEALPVIRKVERFKDLLPVEFRHGKLQKWQDSLSFGMCLQRLRLIAKSWDVPKSSLSNTAEGLLRTLNGIEGRWRELIRRRAYQSDFEPPIDLAADFQELLDAMVSFQSAYNKLRPKYARVLAGGMAEAAAECYYLRAYEGWSWSQIANLLQRRNATSRTENLKNFTRMKARTGVKLVRRLVYGEMKSPD